MARGAHAHFAEDPDRLFWLDGFLSPGLCDQILRELEFAFWRPSTVTAYAPGRRIEVARSRARVSESTDDEWFSTPLRRIIRTIHRRLAFWVPGVPSRCEGWQATRYAKGGKFDFHLDCGHWAHEAAGERARTVLIYLQAPKKGGGTQFRELGLEVQPQPGRLLVWRNLRRDGSCDSDMLHAGVPVRQGGKTVLVNWVRQRRMRRGA